MNSDRDDSRGTRSSSISPLAWVTIIVTLLSALALGVLYYFRFVEKFMAEYSTVAYTAVPAFEVQAFSRKFD
jgi:hypothetical protein